MASRYFQGRFPTDSAFSSVIKDLAETPSRDYLSHERAPQTGA
jgi:hypothetical protein